MSRELGLRDVSAYCAPSTERALKFDFDVIHGHGAKGGAYSRLVARAMKRAGEPVVSCYTPHGGSLHYHPATATGRIYMQPRAAARALHRCDRVRERLCGRALFGPGRRAGLRNARHPERAWHPRSSSPAEPAPDAADFLFVGELRHLKGVDVLLRALAQVRARRTVSAVIVGAGPDAAAYTREAAKHRARRRRDVQGPDARARGLPPGPHARRALARREPALHRARGGRGRPAAAGERCRRHPRDRRRHRYGPASAGRRRCARARHAGGARQPCCRAQQSRSACARPSPSASPSQQ